MLISCIDFAKFFSPFLALLVYLDTKAWDWDFLPNIFLSGAWIYAEQKQRAYTVTSFQRKLITSLLLLTIFHHQEAEKLITQKHITLFVLLFAQKRNSFRFPNARYDFSWSLNNQSFFTRKENQNPQLKNPFTQSPSSLLPLISLGLCNLFNRAR